MLDIKPNRLDHMATMQKPHPDAARIKDCIKRADCDNAQQLAIKAGISPPLLHRRLSNTDPTRISIPVWEKLESVCFPTKALFDAEFINVPVAVAPVIGRDQVEAWLKMHANNETPAPFEEICFNMPPGARFDHVAYTNPGTTPNARFPHPYITVIAVGDVILIDGNTYMVEITQTARVRVKKSRPGHILLRTWDEAEQLYRAKWGANLPTITHEDVTQVIGRVCHYIVDY